MKKTKQIRTLSLLLCCALLLPLLSLTVSAAGTPGLLLTAGDSVKPGQELVVGISIENNPGLSALQLQVTTGVTAGLLTLVDAEAGSDFESASVVPGPEPLPTKVMWLDQAAEARDGQLLVLRLLVDLHAQPGDYNLMVKCLSANTGAEEPVTLSQRSLRFTVLPLSEDEKPALNLSQAYGAPGGLAAVTISTANQLRAVCAELQLDYDRELLELVDVVPAPGFRGNLTWGRETGALVIASLETFPAGEIAICSFRLRSAQAADYPAEISVAGRLFDEEERELFGIAFHGGQVSMLPPDSLTASCQNGALNVLVELHKTGTQEAGTQRYLAYYDSDGRMLRFRPLTVNFGDRDAITISVEETGLPAHGTVTLLTLDTETKEPLAAKLWSAY